MSLNGLLRNLLLVVMSVVISACGSEKPTFSLLEDTNTFLQKGNEVNNKIDILWVIDNSGSMETSQQNVADNFNFFINDFISKGYDFRIAVTTTEAYKVNFGGAESKARFKDGGSGYYIIDKDTPEITATFIGTIIQGISGSGDERAFSSIATALSYETSPGVLLNESFVRPDSFFAVIIISDEDDFSHDTKTFMGGNYGYDGLHSVQSYVDFLDALTSSAPDRRRYTVNAIGIWDDACYADLTDDWPGRLIGTRMGELVDLTGGIKGSLCGNFGQSLSDISSSIIQLSSQFFLDREPLPETIKVIVNGVVVPNKDDNAGPSSGGWSYDAEANSVLFYGSYIPEQGATISITFDPAGLRD